MTVAVAACGEADDSGGKVVAGVTEERELGCSVLAAAGLEQFGGTQDEQCRGAVTNLEGGDSGEQPSKWADKDRADRSRMRLARLVAWSVVCRMA